MTIDPQVIEQSVWDMCDPHIPSITGEGPTYQKFILFVKKFLAPYMSMKFVTEAYYKDLWEEIWSNKNTVHQLPRGHSKTELIGIWATIWIALFQPHNPFYERFKGKKKKIYEQTLLAGGADDLNAWTDRIKEFFDKSPRLQEFKPYGARQEKTTNSWNKKEMMLRNGSKLHLRTMKGKIRGLHVDRVVADDLITESSTLTDTQTIETWDGAVHGTTTSKEALINVIGTPLRYTDIQFHLRNKPEGYYFKARPAILDEQSKRVLSPNRRSYDDLMRIKREIGTTKFSAEYLLNPIDDSVSLIKREHIQACLDQYMEGIWVEPKITRIGNYSKVTIEKKNMFNFRRDDREAVFITADFAFSDRKTADWSVFSYYGLKNTKLHKLGFIRKQGLSAMTQMAILQALHDYFGATMHGYEENSIRGIVNDVGHLNIPMRLYWMGAKDEARKIKDGPQFSGKRETIGKLMAIERLDASYENKKFVLPFKSDRDHEAMTMQIEESISWAQEDGKLVEVGRHPDIPITDILANELLQHYTGKAKTQVFTVGNDVDFEEDKERTIKKGKAVLGEELL